jgi:formamidopyrimidine-DNA glycosylase
MPELPEVETTKAGIEPYVVGSVIKHVVVRQPKLRWPIPLDKMELLRGVAVLSVKRRGKYILLEVPEGTLLIHLGMSGSMRVLTSNQQPNKHDHVDICLENGRIIRFTDPRRFGSILWQEKAEIHPLLAALGPEPLSELFDAQYLAACCKGKTVPIKQLIMNSKVVVGVGNIYASESLFKAGIDPRRASGRISLTRLSVLVEEIKKVLSLAIEQGGTTLKDFVNSEGKPGYFKQSLSVYGRAGEPCLNCHSILKEVKLGQRGTVYCQSCQH